MLPGEACVHHLFEAQVDRTPGAIAVIDRGIRVDYRTLDERANRLAHRLRAAGVGPEVLVGVACARSVEMIVAVLGVLKAGGAYVPLDRAYPRERIELITRDARLAVVVDDTGADGFPATRPEVAVGAEHAMYVLYTSGSTGRPKGVVTTHAAIVNRLRWGEERYPFAPGEIACARTTLGFVDSVAEIFAPLACGVPLVIVGDEAQRDLAVMVRELAAEAVTRIVLVPSLLATLFEIHPDLADRLPALRTWFLGGEPVPVPLVERFGRAMPGRKLVNIYGATEVSGDATYFDFDEMPPGMKNSPIGVALRGCRALVLDDELRELGPMEIGEVCIAGACLARGYLHQPELTRTRFVDSAFGRLYRTGDLGRRLPSGDLEYLGRVDSQVKIRGVRVELGEVEARLAEAAGVAQAAVVAQDGRLVAFYTAAAGAEPGAAALRAHLRARLPEAMVPSFFVALDALPLGTSGKLDRRALAAAKVHVPAGAGDPPVGDDERRIAAIWEAVLGVGPIGRSQDFHDLGGNSLAAARIVAAVQDQLHRKLAIRAVFDHPTVAGLAACVAPPAPPRPAIAVTEQPLPAELPLSYHQVPFWCFQALTGDISVVSDVFAFSQPVEVERLQRAFSDTVASLDALWMRFPRWTPVQRPSPRRPVRFLVEEGGDLQAAADANHAVPFDLEAPPHVHARLVRRPDGDDRLLVAMPHIAVDLTAMELFRRALQRAYAGSAAEAPAASLADLVEWERRAGDDDGAARHWSSLSPRPAWNRMPARLFGHRRAGDKVRAFSSRELPDDLADRLAGYARRRAVSVPIILIAAVGASIAGTAGLDEVTLLLFLEKRERAETRELFGNLASVMPVRLRAAATLDELVARTGEQLLASYEHTDPLMRRPTLFNDFWRDAPAPLRRLVGALGRRLARRWPQARLDPDVLAGYLFALVPWPRRRRADRDVVVAVNVLPEVYQPEPGGPDGFRITRRRSLPLILRPGDLIIGTDPMLDRTLHCHVSRSERGRIAVNLYGGGIDPAGLDEINQRIVAGLGSLG